MKLIFCPECHDLFRLFPKQKRFCICRKSAGKYLEDGNNAVIYGEAIPIGFGNISFAEAIKDRPNNKGFLGKIFTAFVIPKQCDSIKHIRRII